MQNYFDNNTYVNSRSKIVTFAKAKYDCIGEIMM